MTKPADLIAYLFAGQPPLLSAELLQWMEASPRFTLFVETYRDKIRKKIRLARRPESRLDLHAELQVACCLLNDRRLALAYEPYASLKRRGPDFLVTYRANRVFNLEVARIRQQPGEADANDSATDSANGAANNGALIDLPRKEERLLRILLDKLGQMQPGMPNLLVVHTGDELARLIDLDRLMQGIKTRAEGKDPAFYAAGRYPNPAAFYKEFLRLSAVLLWAAEAQLWVNKQARPDLEGKVLRLVGSLLSGC